MEREDSAAVTDFYTHHWGPLVGLLRVAGASAADAEELAQEAFIRLFERWETISSYEDPAAWLRLVAMRMHVSRFRRLRTSRLGLQRLRGGEPAVVEAPSGAASDVATALRALSDDHRAAVLLFYVHDLSVAEIAEGLRIPVGTVKSRLARAREQLSASLAAYDTTGRTAP